MLNESTIWIVNKESHNTQIHCRILPRRTCKPCGFIVKISSKGKSHLVYIAKRNTKTDGMGPFKRFLKQLSRYRQV